MQAQGKRDQIAAVEKSFFHLEFAGKKPAGMENIIDHLHSLFPAFEHQSKRSRILLCYRLIRFFLECGIHHHKKRDDSCYRLF